MSFLRGRLFSADVVLSAGVLLLAASGCALNEAVYYHNGTRIVYMRPPLQAVVDELDARHEAVDSVVTRLAAVLHNNEKNKDVALEGVYLGDREGNMRLRISATTGQLVLDMGTHNDIVDIWLPRKNRYFQGKREDLLVNSKCQLSLLAHVGRARDLFFPRAWTDNAVKRAVTFQNGREVISVIEKPNWIRRRARRIVMAPESACIESIDVYDKFGREVGTVGYSDWRFPDPDAESATQACPVVYPGCITLNSPDGVYTLELRPEDISLNTPIPVSKFKVPNTEHVKILDLGQALRNSGNLWE